MIQLMSHTPQAVRMLKGEDLAGQLAALGYDAVLTSQKASFSLARYDFDLTDPKRFLTIDRAIAILSAVNHRRLSRLPSTTSMFSLVAPLEDPQPVYFAYCNPIATSSPTASIGLDGDGARVLIDFEKCPHLLIAGATGAGKSTLMKTLLASLLLNGGGRDLFAFVDPKRVELSDFAMLPNCIAHAEDAAEALALFDRLIGEMTNRYKRMEAQGLTSAQGRADYPPIFCIVDELADLMLVSRYEAETAIIRIAQLGRAANIHLILATQRPTVNVVTGLIKANITTRVALQVASVRDSMTILDHGGAERLLGRGDAIIKYPYSVDEQRFQSALTENRDIEAIVASIN